MLENAPRQFSAQTESILRDIRLTTESVALYFAPHSDGTDCAAPRRADSMARQLHRLAFAVDEAGIFRVPFGCVSPYGPPSFAGILDGSRQRLQQLPQFLFDFSLDFRDLLHRNTQFIQQVPPFDQ